RREPAERLHGGIVGRSRYGGLTQTKGRPDEPNQEAPNNGEGRAGARAQGAPRAEAGEEGRTEGRCGGAQAESRRHSSGVAGRRVSPRARGNVSASRYAWGIRASSADPNASRTGSSSIRSS